MPIPEPEGILWPLVKALSGWPETNEDSIRQLADGWWAAGAAFHAAGEHDPGPLATAWPDEAGQAFGTRVAGIVTKVNETESGAAGLVTQATRLADAVTHAKTSIRTLMSAGAELAEGAGTKFNIGPDQDLNWHLALGNVKHSATGVVTVHPPADPGGAHQIEVTHRTHFHDHYNWDPHAPEKAVHIGGVAVPGTDDPFLSQFHRAGTAQEYDTVGSSVPRTETREYR